MKRIYFRLLAIFLSLFLTFSILYKDYIQADALEWVGVAVGYDTAFKFLLGLLGVTVGVGVAEEVDWGTLRENAIQVQLDQGNSQAEVSAWWSNVIHGSLDTASSCWSSFKEFVSDLVSEDSASGSNISYSAISSVNSSLDLSSLSSDELNFMFNHGVYWVDSSNYTHFFFTENGDLIIYNNQIRFVATDSIVRYFSCVFNANNVPTSHSLSTGTFTVSINSNYQYYLYGANSSTVYPNNCHVWGLSGSSISSDFEALYPNIGDIALNPENADTLGVDVIPLPWENIGVSEDAIQDIIDDAIERVINGTMSLENYWEYVQNITNTYAYSIENNYLLPNENGEDKKADDKVKENTENGAFVLYGLEKVFPFCIPFDIYAFITLLKADPVAPVIEYPIYNPVTQQNEIITIDFSEWESVVIIFRYIFDFLLIIGLLLLARPLVGAGGDS